MGSSSIIRKSIFRYVVLTFGTIVSAITLGVAQDAFRPYTFRTLGNAAPGMYMVTPPSIDSGAFLDHGGQWRFRFPAKRLTNFQQHGDGSYTGFTMGNTFTRWNSNMEVVGQLSADGFDTDFHDVKVIPGGKYLVLGTEYRTVDMSALVAGGLPNAVIMGMVLQERTFDGQTTWTWKSLDHIPVTDATSDINLRQSVIDYIHPNSIWLDTDGNILVSCRHLDEVIKVSRSTGAVMWRWGGSGSKGNEFTWLNDTKDGFTGFSHQHTVQRLADGTILMFDNGNLRPGGASRAVKYRINEVTKTAERVWEYDRFGSVVSQSMGSAEELSNGNVVIGWGNNTSGLVLTEVTPSGDVVAEIVADPGYPSSSYRVSKTQFAMVGAQRNVTSTGVYAFDHNGESVGATLTVLTPSTANVTIERHRNQSALTATPVPAPCRYLPIRWTVRAQTNGPINGTLSFSFENATWLSEVTAIVMYNRAIEGVGQWAKVQGTYNEATKTFTTNAFAVGEYMVGSEVCLTPTLREPLPGQQRVPLSARLEWTAAQNELGYEVVVATAASFAPATIAFRDTVDSLVAVTTKLASLTTYFWRVRSLRTSGPGQWSETGWFKTTIDIPTMVRPVITGRDTVAYIPTSGFAWTSVPFAKQYQIRVYELSDGAKPVIDRTVSATSDVLLNLAPNTWYEWEVRSVTDSIASQWSQRALFITAPDVPMPLTPRDSAEGLSREGLPVAWRSVHGATGYDIRVTVGATTDVVFNRVVKDTMVTMPLLVFDTTYVWAVRAVGAYGPGAWSREQRFRTIARDVFPPAVLLSPLPLDILGRNEVELRWYHPRAESFVVNVYESRDAEGPIWTMTTKATSAVIPSGFLQSDVEYYWDVTSLSATGEVSVTERWMFSVSVPPVVVIGLRAVFPGDGAENVPIEGDLVWSADSRMSSYRVQMFDQSGSPVLSMTVMDTVLGYTGLRRGGRYTWRVIGMRGDEAIDTGAVASFTTVLPVTSVVDGTNEAPTVERSGSAVRLIGADTNVGVVHLYNLQGVLFGRYNVGEWVPLHGLPAGVYVLHTSQAPSSHVLIHWMGGQ
jgi:hypothetical protein